jgi:phospholipid transport system substrate-binding protein
MLKAFVFSITVTLTIAGLPFATPALAASVQTFTPAETFVADNIQKGLAILNNKQLSIAQRQTQFQTFLIGLTDMKRIADFALGQYRRDASPADLTAFESAFQNYAIAVYQSYFAKYAGQDLTVTGSTERAPDDFVVRTTLIDPGDHRDQPPQEVDFRVRTDTGRPVVLDFSFAGVSLALMERDQFTTFLGQNSGSVRKLILQLNVMTTTFKRPSG